MVRQLNKQMRYPVYPSTELCIEAYPSSANSFMFVLLRRFAPDLEIAHHTHAVASLKRAVQLGTPTIFILRNPADAISSRMARFRVPVHPCLQHYVWLYRFVVQHGVTFHLTEFGTLRDDLELSLRRALAYIGRETALDEAALSELKKSGFEEIDAHWQSYAVASQSATPSAKRDSEKARLKQIVIQHPLYEEADALYKQLSARIV